MERLTEYVKHPCYLDWRLILANMVCLPENTNIINIFLPLIYAQIWRWRNIRIQFLILLRLLLSERYYLVISPKQRLRQRIGITYTCINLVESQMVCIIHASCQISSNIRYFSTVNEYVGSSFVIRKERAIILCSIIIPILRGDIF